MSERIIHPQPAAPEPAPRMSEECALAWCLVGILLVFQAVSALSAVGVWL